MDNEPSLKERHEALWEECAKLRMEVNDTRRRAERAEATVASMIHALRPVLPVGFRGDNPIWACEKLTDHVGELTSTNWRMTDEDAVNKVIIANLQGTIEDLTEEIRKMQGEWDGLRVRVWNRTLNACGGVGEGEKIADYVAKAFDDA